MVVNSQKNLGCKVNVSPTRSSHPSHIPQRELLFLVFLEVTSRTVRNMLILLYIHLLTLGNVATKDKDFAH